MYTKASKFCVDKLNGRLLYAENVDEFKYLYSKYLYFQNKVFF